MSLIVKCLVIKSLNYIPSDAKMNK